MTIIPLILTCLLCSPVAAAPVASVQAEAPNAAVYDAQAVQSREQNRQQMQARTIASIKRIDSIQDATMQIVTSGDDLVTQITVTLTATPGHNMTETDKAAVKTLVQNAWATQAAQDVTVTILQS